MRYLHISLAGLVALALLAGPVADGKTTCPAPPEQRLDVMTLLHSYIAGIRDSPDELIVAGIGNAYFLFDSNLDPVMPDELAAVISSNARFGAAKQVVLAWSYSGWDKAPYLHAVEALLHKPVVGFSGPIWMYPDGAIIASKAETSNIQGPNQSNVAQCIGMDGKYHDDRECAAVLAAHDLSQGIFSNTLFVIPCSDIPQLEISAANGDGNADMKLFFLNYFVNIDGDKAVQYLTKAASLGVPRANYLTAIMVRDTTPDGPSLYRQLLGRAAVGGDKKAAGELAKLGAK